MFKSHASKRSALLLAAAFLFTCVTVSAQDAASTQLTPPVVQSDALAVTQPSESAEAGPKNEAAILTSHAPDADAPSRDSDGIGTDGGQEVAGIGRTTAGRELLAPKTFEWQGGQSQGQGQNGATPNWTPLTGEEKMKRAAKTVFLSPFGYASTAFSAALTEYTEDDLPNKTNEDRFADFASRFAIRFTTRATNTLLGSGVFPVLFKQDPRYVPAAKGKNVFKRAAHAASRVFVTNDDEGNLEPNYSRWAGAFSSSAIANLYEQSTPGRDRIGTDATFRRFGTSFTSGMVNNIIREFLPDLIGIFKK